MRVRRRRQSLSQPEEIDLVHHQNPNHQPQSFGDFAHGHCTAAVHQVNLLALLLLPLQEQGDLTSTVLETRRYRTPHARRPSFARKLEKSTSCASFPYCFPTTTTTRLPERTTSLQSILIDDNGTPATWTLVLSSSKP